MAADARQMLARVAEHKAAFDKADAGRKHKVLGDEWLKELESTIVALERALGGQTSDKAAIVKATAAEVRLRGELFDAIAEIRDTVKLAMRGDPATARAFGVGQRISLKVTSTLVMGALSIEQAYVDPAHPEVADGIVPARDIAKLARLRAALQAADTTQNTRLSSRKGATRTKMSLMREVQQGAAHIRSAAKLVFRRDPNTLAQFASTLPRYASRKTDGGAGAAPPSVPAGSRVTSSVAAT